ncbi:MAG: DUF2188 domain-containing protein [Gemmatimonadaceae bacterium]
MKRGGGVHTLPNDGKGWINKVNGKVISRHRSKDDAVEAGREIARKLELEHTTHRSDGVITEANSYGNDPCPPKDGN